MARFRLATILKLREAHRDELRAHLAEALRADTTLSQRNDELAAELSSILAQAHNAALPGRINVDRLIDNQRYELLLRVAQLQLAEERRLLNEELEIRRQALVAADREVRVLERLRELASERERHAAEQLERKLLDEVAGRRGESES